MARARPDSAAATLIVTLGLHGQFTGCNAVTRALRSRAWGARKPREGRPGGGFRGLRYGT